MGRALILGLVWLAATATISLVIGRAMRRADVRHAQNVRNERRSRFAVMAAPETGGRPVARGAAGFRSNTTPPSRPVRPLSTPPETAAAPPQPAARHAAGGHSRGCALDRPPDRGRPRLVRRRRRRRRL